MCGAGVRAYDHCGFLAALGGGCQGGAEALHTGVGQRLGADRIAAIAADRHDDFLRSIGHRLGTGHRQLQLEFGELAVGGGQHQENQHHQQHVDERDQIDLGLIARAGTKVHPALPFLAGACWQRLAWHGRCRTRPPPRRGPLRHPLPAPIAQAGRDAVRSARTPVPASADRHPPWRGNSARKSVRGSPPSGQTPCCRGRPKSRGQVVRDCRRRPTPRSVRRKSRSCRSRCRASRAAARPMQWWPMHSNNVRAGAPPRAPVASRWACSSSSLQRGLALSTRRPLPRMRPSDEFCSSLAITSGEGTLRSERVIASSSNFGGTILRRCRLMKRSITSASARIEQITNGQMGQPAACMIEIKGDIQAVCRAGGTAFGKDYRAGHLGLHGFALGKAPPLLCLPGSRIAFPPSALWPAKRTRWTGSEPI